MAVRRDALGLGLVASLFALFGRRTARAADDAVVIGADGVVSVKGRRNRFSDEENAGNLRVGAAWGVPGIYSEKGPVVIGGENGNIWLHGKVGIGADKKVPSQSLDVDGTIAAATFSGNDATLKQSLTVEGGVKKGLTVAGAGVTELPPAGANTLDVVRATRSKLEVAGPPKWAGDHPTGLALYVTAESGPASNGVEFRHSNGTQGIGFGYNTIYATGSHPNQSIILKARGTGSVLIGDYVALNANPLRNRMYPQSPKIYQEVFDALRQGAIAKLGQPSYDDTSYRQTELGARHIISFGSNNEADGNGALVTIPAGYDTVWVRVLGERWNVIHAYFLNNNNSKGDDLGSWVGGRRSLNSYAPDGTLADGFDVQHQWVAIPAGHDGRLALISKPNTDQGFWISGLAFSKNPWAHATQSALGYHWAVNGGNAVEWVTHDWESDVLAKMVGGKRYELKVPVVPSGRDKLLYLIEHNANWNGAMHTAITVNGTPIERFMATYDNPFARQWNSKFRERYIATRIPKELIASNAHYISVVIDLSKQNRELNFREIGAHDLDVPVA